VMDSYIHYKTYTGLRQPIEIRFISDYEVKIDYNRYGAYTPNQNGFYNAGYEN